MSVVTDLENAWNLIKDGKNITGPYARTITGEACDPEDPAATCFCSLGAVWKVSESSRVHWKPRAINMNAMLVRASEALYAPDHATCNETGQNLLLEQIWLTAIEMAKAEEEPPVVPIHHDTLEDFPSEVLVSA